MLPFTLKQLEIFVVAAENLSISEAGRILYLSQPAISQQIRKIENYSKIRLFEQLGKKLYLTEQGKSLLVYAKNVLEQAKLFAHICRSDGSFENEILKIGINIPLQPIFFKILKNFIQQHPMVTFKFYDGSRHVQLQNLYENKIDFCVMIETVDKIKLTNTLLANSSMSFITSIKHHSVTKKTGVSLEKLNNDTFIVSEEESANYSIIHELFKKMGTKPPKLVQIKDQNAIKQAVIANLGISILPKFMVEHELENSLLAPLTIKGFEPPKKGIYWIQHTDKKLLPMAKLFKSYLVDKLKRII